MTHLTEQDPSSLTVDQILSVRPLVAVGTPQWSPDGTRIVFVSSLSGTAELWSIPAEGGVPTRMTVGAGEGGAAPRLPLWSPDGAYLSSVSKGSGTDEVWLWPLNGAPGFRLTTLGGRIQSMAWAPDGRSVAVSCNRYGSYDIYLVDVPHGKARRLTDGPLYAVNPVFTPDGGHIFYVQLDDRWVDHDVIRITLDGKDQHTVVRDEHFFDYSHGAAFGQPMVSSDGERILFRSQRNGHINIWTAPVRGGSPEPLAAEEAEQGDAVWSPTKQQVAYTSNHNGTLELRVADVATGVSRTLCSPGTGVCATPQWSPDGSHVSFRYGSPNAPMELWTVSLEDGETRQVTNAGIAQGLTDRLAMPEKVTYTSFDGLTIHAYLYGPQGRRPGAQYPGLLFIHGGPTSQFIDDFQPYVQFYVQRGYVVLLPNIRGSSGYGRAFEELNNGDWGGNDSKGRHRRRRFPEGAGLRGPERHRHHGDQLRGHPDDVRGRLRSGEVPGGSPHVGVQRLACPAPTARAPAHQVPGA